MLSLTKDGARKNLIYRTVFHSLFQIYNTFVSVYGLQVVLSSIDEEDIKRSINVANISEYFIWFGTQWNLLYQALYFNMALIYDVLEWRNAHTNNFGKKLKYARDLLFNGITVPTTFIVFGFFWGVYAWDRELVFSKDLDKYVPSWFNHCMHTLIVVMVAIEAILEPRVEPKNRKVELSLNAGFAVLYFTCYYYIYFTTGRWLYAIYNIFNNWWQCTLFQMFVFFLYYLYYTLQFPICRWIHGDVKEKQDINEVKSETLNIDAEVRDVRDSVVLNDRRNYNIKVNVNEELVSNYFEGYENNSRKINGNSLREINDISKTENRYKINKFGDKDWGLKYRLIRDRFENFNR